MHTNFRDRLTDYLPELLAAPLLPFLIAQGRRTRRITPRLPEAAGPDSGVAGSRPEEKPLTLLAIGESPVAGVGVGTHEEAITGQLACALAERLRRPVAWRACGKNGVTVGDALECIVPALPVQPVDLVLVAFGVNDTTAFHSVTRWKRDLTALLDAVEQRCMPRLVLLAGVPHLEAFPALPQPLRTVLGMKARVLDRAAGRIAAMRAHTLHVPMALDGRDRGLMAHDGYHPSVKGCIAWAQTLARACPTTW